MGLIKILNSEGMCRVAPWTLQAASHAPSSAYTYIKDEDFLHG